MKKLTKRVLALLMVLTMLFTAIPVSAGHVSAEIFKKAGCMRVAPKDKQMMSYGATIGTVFGTNKVTVKSSNKKVVTVKTFPIGMPGEEGVAIEAYPKKNGTATITVKVGKKTYKCKFTMCNYKNPVSYVKIGKYKVSGKSFNKTTKNKSLRYSKLAGKNAKIQVKMKNGWKVHQMLLMKAKTGADDPIGMEAVENGQTVKISGGAGTHLVIHAHDPKTGVNNMFTVVLR